MHFFLVHSIGTFLIPLCPFVQVALGKSMKFAFLLSRMPWALRPRRSSAITCLSANTNIIISIRNIIRIFLLVFFLICLIFFLRCDVRYSVPAVSVRISHSNFPLMNNFLDIVVGTYLLFVRILWQFLSHPIVTFALRFRSIHEQWYDPDKDWHRHSSKNAEERYFSRLFFLVCSFWRFFEEPWHVSVWWRRNSLWSDCWYMLWKPCIGRSETCFFLRFIITPSVWKKVFKDWFWLFFSFLKGEVIYGLSCLKHSQHPFFIQVGFLSRLCRLLGHPFFAP